MVARTTTILRTQSSSSMSSTVQVAQSQSSCACAVAMRKESSSSGVNPINQVRRRRKFKSALFFAWTIVSCVIFSQPTTTHAFSAVAGGRSATLSQRKHEWIERSVQYYSTVMMKNARGTQLAEVSPSQQTNTMIADHLDSDFVGLATKHYYARFLIKKGKLNNAEMIYRRIIADLTAEEDACDHTKLAVSTLLLALHMQRTGDIKATRAVFLNFFRRIALVNDGDEEDHKCSCSAKVLQAYALFEMKNGHSAKSLEIIQRAIRMDEKLSPVLEWKQFRDAAAGREYVPRLSLWNRSKKKSKKEEAVLSP